MKINRRISLTSHCFAQNVRLEFTESSKCVTFACLVQDQKETSQRYLLCFQSKLPTLGQDTSFPPHLLPTTKRFQVEIIKYGYGKTNSKEVNDARYAAQKFKIKISRTR